MKMLSSKVQKVIVFGGVALLLVSILSSGSLEDKLDAVKDIATGTFVVGIIYAITRMFKKDEDTSHAPVSNQLMPNFASAAKKLAPVIGGAIAGFVVFAAVAGLCAALVAGVARAVADDASLDPNVFGVMFVFLVAVVPWVPSIWGGYKAYKYLKARSPHEGIMDA